MAQKNSNQKISGIYAITPDETLNLNQVEPIIIRHNISILQYRHQIDDTDVKHNEALALHQLCLEHHTLFIINDDINLAKKVKADGVHLGKNDSSVVSARETLGNKAIIGVSCYNNLNLAIKAQQSGADYVAFGALFPSKTKPNATVCSLDVVKQARQKLTLPIVGVGGIDFNNQQIAFDAGCYAVAMINALWAS